MNAKDVAEEADIHSTHEPSVKIVGRILGIVATHIDGDKLYPRDIFKPLTKRELELVHSALIEKSGGTITLDRVSAQVARAILNNWRDELRGTK